ncbi:MAG TPA: transglycosylase domain-containing protein [Candidatus Limnocylindrales bacterium]|nr:transglycosylase domain-containing protein [Candidatus Limnocylindrales bacterium]
MAFVLAFVGLIGLSSLSAVLGVATGLTFVEKMESELPSVAGFEQLDFAEPSVIYDRTGTIELARFQVERRRVVEYDDIPKVLLDATIAVEDRSFWSNEGYDPNGIAAAAVESVTGVRDRGASTITQQFVRARLLPQDVLEGDLWTRKIKEILQARNLTRAYPGEEGKQRILTAYLNQIYYGHQAYGVAAAAEVYFGITDLKLLTPSQAAVLAGLPQAPDTYDLYKWAKRDSLGRLYVPTISLAGEQLPPPIERRNFILGALEEGNGNFIRLTKAQLDQSLREPVVLNEPEPVVFKAPHFVWYMKSQLDQILADRAPAERGGYKVITSIDMHAQELAEKYVSAGTILTNMPPGQMNAAIEAEGLQADREWISNLHGMDIHNGALVAMDARTGQILAHVGSAGYYRDDLASGTLDPKFDVAGRGYRQPGSAWKPLVYAAGFDTGEITPGTLLLDVTTEFSRGWVPRDADLKERGPVLVRDALTYSLNIPVIRALDRVGVDTVAALASQMGLTFARGDRHLAQAGLAGAIGTAETNMVELTSAYGALANRGLQYEPQAILEIRDRDENVVPLPATAPRQVVSEQAAWLTTDILKDSTDPLVNTVFGPRLQVVNESTDPLLPDGVRRYAAAKTGTTNDLRDLSVYGYLAPPADPNAPHVVASVWIGNSDHSPPLAGGERVPILAADGPGRIWSAYLRELSKDWPNAPFPSPPQGIAAATIDLWSGGGPGPWTRETRVEYFIEGTQPGGSRQVDPNGLLYRQMCGRWFVDVAKVEQDAPERWVLADLDWMDRARRGAGRRGEHNSSTARLFGRQDWGGFIAPIDCSLAPTPAPLPPSSPGPTAPPLPEPTPGPTVPPAALTVPAARTTRATRAMRGRRL